jgi:pyruvate kinase
VIGERLGIPVIVGVANATRDVRQGEVVTLDVRHGVVHRGTHVHDHSSADNIG